MKSLEAIQQKLRNIIFGIYFIYFKPLILHENMF